ncbi:MAG: hypothetical protein Kilf2KO_00540 [Rhodospirillales bacterium]
MYVCICNAYRSCEIAAAASRGLDDAEDIYHELGSGPICRRCLDEAQALVDAHCPASADC